MAKKKLHIHAESSDNGGYTVKSHKSKPMGMHGGMMPSDHDGDEPTDHTFGSHKQASDHIAQLMAAHAGGDSSPAPSDNDGEEYASHPMKSHFGPRKR